MESRILIIRLVGTIEDTHIVLVGPIDSNLFESFEVLRVTYGKIFTFGDELRNLNLIHVKGNECHDRAMIGVIG
jgi:hypothetical protein